MQVRIGAETASLIVATWKLLDPSDDDSVRRWLAVTSPVIATQYAASVRLSESYYQALRLAEIGETWAPVTPAAMVDEQVQTSLLVTGPVAYRAARGRGIPEREALEGAQRTSARAAMRQALNGGRAALLSNAHADHRSAGWRRVASAGACSYCTARTGTVVIGDSADFHSHDGCGCSAEPLFAA